jgi:hypothetical protein
MTKINKIETNLFADGFGGISEDILVGSGTVL